MKQRLEWDTWKIIIFELLRDKQSCLLKVTNKWPDSYRKYQVRAHLHNWRRANTAQWEIVQKNLVCIPSWSFDSNFSLFPKTSSLVLSHVIKRRASDSDKEAAQGNDLFEKSQENCCHWRAEWAPFWHVEKHNSFPFGKTWIGHK